jgi:hypothetical protein
VAKSTRQRRARHLNGWEFREMLTSEWKSVLERQRHLWEDNIKTCLTERIYEYVE